MPDGDINRNDLRAIARRAAEGKTPDVASLSPEDVQHLLYEFGVYQNELLAQNDELQEARAALEDARDRFQELFELAPVGYATVDTQGVILEVNQTLCRLLQTTRAELLGCPLHRMIAPAQQGDLATHLSNALQSESALACELRTSLQEKGMPSHLQLQSLPAGPAFGESLLFTAVMDVSERRRMEKELIEAKGQAEAASKAKSQFLANMSHEIRTPMNGFRGMLQLLELTGLDDMQKDYVAAAKEASDGLLAIINDILDISRIEAGRMELETEPFGLRELCNGVCRIFEKQARDKGLQMVCTIEEHLPEAWRGDPQRIRQILFNLLGNAVKFTREGSVRLDVRQEEGSAATSRLTFTVKDTGMGIPAEARQNLFQPFVQVSAGYTKKTEGTGLGLAIVKRLTHLMGGEVSLSSAPGFGTSVLVTLPLEEVPEEEQEQAESQEPRPSVQEVREKLRVLLVEDSRINRIVCVDHLEHCGHQALEAENGRQALEMLAREPVDVVLMDVQMPEMDGREATRRIRNGEAGCPADIPIIALTAYAMQGDRERILEAGMDDYLAKPVEFEDMEELLREVVRRRKGNA